MARLPPRCLTAAGLVLAAALLVPAAPAGAESSITPETLTDEHVRKAIDAIVEELYRRKTSRHFWDPGQWQPRHGSHDRSHLKHSSTHHRKA